MWQATTIDSLEWQNGIELSKQSSKLCNTLLFKKALSLYNIVRDLAYVITQYMKYALFNLQLVMADAELKMLPGMEKESDRREGKGRRCCLGEEQYLNSALTL